MKTAKEQSRCPICHDKVTVKDGKFIEHPKIAWNYKALELGSEYRCEGSWKAPLPGKEDK